MINQKFATKLQKKSGKGSWTYILWPQSVEFFGTKGLVKVSGTIDGTQFKSAFMAMGNGTHMLPIKAEIRDKINKQSGDIVTIVITNRL
jgi:hypothetical protein